MSDAVYFPAFHGEAECHKCEREDCHSRGAHQRNRRDFTVTSRRCPKIPDRRGFVDESQRENQRKAYPLVHAESDGDSVVLTLSLPEEKPKLLRVSMTKSGYFWVRAKDADLGKIKRVIQVAGCNMSLRDIKEFMRDHHCDYCIFDVFVTDNIL